MTLDTVFTDKQLRELAAQRQLKRYGRLVDHELARIDRLALSVGRRRDLTISAQVGPADWPVRGMRWINALQVRISAAPRTKKNSTTLGVKQSPGYRAYRDTIVNGFAPLLGHLELPLPPIDYTLRATFYVDKRGERADLVNLLQGLADALENAGVVENDRQFRSLDGSRIIAGDPHPRVEALITAIEALT